MMGHLLILLLLITNLTQGLKINSVVVPKYAKVIVSIDLNLFLFSYCINIKSVNQLTTVMILAAQLPY